MLNKCLFLFFVLICFFLNSCKDIKNADEKSKLIDGFFIKVDPSKAEVKENDILQLDNIIKNDYPNINSLLIVVNDKLLFEKYYNGTNIDTADNIYSITKSIISSLVGICLDKKIIHNLDRRIIDYLPEYFNDGIEKEKGNITIRNMLTMTSGLESTDNDYNKWFQSSDWILCTLNNKIIKKTGTYFIYDTGSTHILSAMITKATGKSTYDFAKEVLFDPMDIKIKNWDKDPKGYYCGGTGLYLTSRDLVKFGYLYLKKGVWKGKQIIPEDWIKISTSQQIKTDFNQGYGYLWWKKNPGFMKGNTDSIFLAAGYGGQFIFIYPEKNLVAVITSDPYLTNSKKISSDKIIYEKILPMID